MEVHRVNIMGQKGTKVSPNAVAIDEIHSRRGNSSYIDINVNHYHFHNKVRYSLYLHQVEFASLPSMEPSKHSCTLLSQDDFLNKLLLKLFSFFQILSEYFPTYQQNQPMFPLHRTVSTDFVPVIIPHSHSIPS